MARIQQWTTTILKKMTGLPGCRRSTRQHVNVNVSLAQIFFPITDGSRGVTLQPETEAHSAAWVCWMIYNVLPWLLGSTVASSKASYLAWLEIIGLTPLFSSAPVPIQHEQTTFCLSMLLLKRLSILAPPVDWKASGLRGLTWVKCQSITVTAIWMTPAS